MMNRYCVPNIPIIASLCAHGVTPFVIEDVRMTPVYQGRLTLFRNLKDSHAPEELPRELPWSTTPPAN